MSFYFFSATCNFVDTETRLSSISYSNYPSRLGITKLQEQKLSLSDRLFCSVFFFYCQLQF